MLIEIGKIQVKDRIRKSFGDIDELANDIKDNGLINPPVVTPEYELIAGERRLRALQMLEYKQIEVRVMAVNDAEHQLNLEISENEIRKDFSKKERIDYARRLERLERVKAEQRIKSKQFGEKSTALENFPEPDTTGNARDIVAEKMGIGSGKQYEKEKFIVDNADSETLKKWDTGDISTHAAFIKIKQEKDIAENKVKELENKVQGYKNKLEIQHSKLSNNSTTTKNDDSLNEIIEEKNRLEAEKRKEYERAEQYKKQLDSKPKEVIKEVVKEVIPDDYEALKRRSKSLSDENLKLSKLANEARKELDNIKFLEENKCENPVGVPTYDYNHFEDAVRNFQRNINPFMFMNLIFSEMNQQERNNYLVLIEQTQEYLTKINNCVKGVNNNEQKSC